MIRLYEIAETVIGYFLLFTTSGIKDKKNAILRGSTTFVIDKTCELELGEGVLLNSLARRYHTHMHSRVKIQMDRPNATIKIGAGTKIYGSCIHAQKSIKIGKNCLIAANSLIIDGNAHRISLNDPSKRANTIGNPRPVVLEDNVWLGTGVIVLPGVTIGEGSVIGAGSVVDIDIPKGVIAKGNPIIVLPSK